MNGGTPFVYNNGAYLTDPDARFIAVNATGSYSTNPNTYTLSFDLTGYNASTASVTGEFASDNWADAYLNGNALASQPHSTVASNFQTLFPFSASGADFVTGINTFSFVVTGTGAPSALLVDFESSSVRAATPGCRTLHALAVCYGSCGRRRYAPS